MANFFSTDAFLNAVGKTVYPDSQVDIVGVQVAGQPFRILKYKNKYQLEIPWLDFMEPDPSAAPPLDTLRFLPIVCLDNISVKDWQGNPPENMEASPWIDWGKFPTFDAFVKYANQQHVRAFSKKNAYKLRKIERQVGEVTFDFDSQDRDILELCFELKSAQYRRSDIPDILAPESKFRDMFRLLFDQGHLKMATMKAGEHVLAISLGVIWDKRYHFWVAAFEPEFGKYSGGGILLEKKLEWSFEQGHREFDFLWGDEVYKFYYATDVRCLGPLGTPPLSYQAWKFLREVLMTQIRKHERIYQLLSRLKREYLTKSYQ